MKRKYGLRSAEKPLNPEVKVLPFISRWKINGDLQFKV